MSVYLEMQIDEMADEITALKAINQKIQLEKNALKEQFSLQGVSHRRELLFRFANDWNNEGWHAEHILESDINRFIEKEPK